MIIKTLTNLNRLSSCYAWAVNKTVESIKNPISISDILTLIVSIANLGFIIYFYFKDAKNKRDEEVLKKKSFWFRNIILDKKINRIEKFWDNSMNTFSDCLGNPKDIDGIKMKVNIIITEKRSIIKEVNDYLRIIDDTIGKKLDDILDDFEDYYTKTISGLCLDLESNSKIKTIEDYESEQGNYQKDYLKNLYEFELNGYECKEE